MFQKEKWIFMIWAELILSGVPGRHEDSMQKTCKRKLFRKHTLKVSAVGVIKHLNLGLIKAMFNGLSKSLPPGVLLSAPSRVMCL